MVKELWFYIYNKLADSNYLKYDVMKTQEKTFLSSAYQILSEEYKPTLNGNLLYNVAAVLLAESRLFNIFQVIHTWGKRIPTARRGEQEGYL